MMKSLRNGARLAARLFRISLPGIFLATVAGAETTDRFFEVRARKFEFEPNILTVSRGDTVRIRLLSEDVSHGIYIDGYDVHAEAYPGKDGSLRFTADKPGRFIFRCSVTCGEFHPYMVGHLRVTPNTPFRTIVATGAVLAALLLGYALKRPGDEPRFPKEDTPNDA